MKKTKLLLVLALILVVCGSVFAGGGQAPQGTPSSAAAIPASGVLPRNETLYYNGILWGAVTHFNPYGSGGVSFGLDSNVVARQLIYETLFLYNTLDGKMYPHIGETYSWSGQTLTVTIRRDVRFNNGQPLTAEDVAHSFRIHKEYPTRNSGMWGYLSDVVVKDNYTVEFKGNPAKFNPGFNMEALCSTYITSKAEWDRILKETDPNRGTPQSNRMAVAQYRNLEPVTTGAYKPLLWDETKCVLVRDDNYWGKAKYGKLPAPRYIAHSLYKDNAAGDEAFRAGEVDVSQQFINQVWRMWEAGIPVETYLPEAPYYLAGVTTAIVFNTTKPGLSDAVVRRAIALTIDYPSIAVNATSGYTAPVRPHLMIPNPLELAYVDEAALRPYGWSDDRAARVVEANRILDAAGWVRGADGIRAKGGVKLSFLSECAAGATDAMAMHEIVAQGAKEVGIELIVGSPQRSVWEQSKDNTTFDIVNHNFMSIGPSSPWYKFYVAMGSADIPPVGTTNQVQNWGRWMNQEVNQLLQQAASETDPAKLKQIYTRLNVIYLQEMPLAVTRHRTVVYHTVNTSVWQGFPKIGDGTNIPPLLCADGYGFMSLFRITPKR